MANAHWHPIFFNFYTQFFIPHTNNHRVQKRIKKKQRRCYAPYLNTPVCDTKRRENNHTEQSRTQNLPWAPWLPISSGLIRWKVQGFLDSGMRSMGKFSNNSIHRLLTVENGLRQSLCSAAAGQDMRSEYEIGFWWDQMRASILFFYWVFIKILF